MVCDTYLQKHIVKLTFSGTFCKRSNTFDNFSTDGHPTDTESGPPPRVAISSGTLGTQKVVPHLGSISSRFPVGFRSVFGRFPDDFRTISGRFPIDFRSISDRFWIFFRPIFEKSKKFTKIVPVKSPELSRVPFCTEFWCESNRDDGVSQNPVF